MAEIHTQVTIDKSGSQVVFHNPDGPNGSQPLGASDVPTPAKSGTQTTVKVIGTPGSTVRFSNPS